jgi:hypothetical protein
MRDMRANLGVFRTCVLAVVALLCLQSGASAVPATPADGSHGFAAGAAYAADQPWTAQGDPAIVQKVVHFDNGDVHLTGTLFMPAAGDHLAAVVVLHPAEQPTRAYALYRHLTEGLPAMRMAVLVYDRRGSGTTAILAIGASPRVAGCRSWLLQGTRRPRSQYRCPLPW